MSIVTQHRQGYILGTAVMGLLRKVPAWQGSQLTFTEKRKLGNPPASLSLRAALEKQSVLEFPVPIPRLPLLALGS